MSASGLDGLASRAAGVGRMVLDLVLPPRCLSCGAVVDRSGAVCADCWSRIAFLGPPFCAICGFPFDHDMGPAALCGACAARPPAYRHARAVMRYDDGSRELLLRLKHADRTDAVPAFGGWMARAGAELLDQDALIVPVPLHRTRLIARRYNQAALLAQAAGRTAGVAAVPDLLVRRRRTASQAGLGASARRRNVRGAFAVRPGWQDRVAGRHVVLIDDVLTTGATVEACARVLLRAGASAVDVLTLARVVRPTVIA